MWPSQCAPASNPTGRSSSRGHSWRGAVRARNILWRRGVPFAEREQVAAIVRHHLVPFFMAESENPQRLAIEVSQSVRCDWLALMAESDARGRTCPDPERILGQIAAFRERAAAFGCLSQPYPFASDQARFQYFRDAHRLPDAPVEEKYSCEAILMCGLPGAGKDFWIRKNMPEANVISLDALRIEMGVAPSDPQGTVLNRAREIAHRIFAGEEVVHLERVEFEPLCPQRVRQVVQRTPSARADRLCGSAARPAVRTESATPPQGSGKRDRAPARSLGGSGSDRSASD